MHISGKLIRGLKNRGEFKEKQDQLAYRPIDKPWDNPQGLTFLETWFTLSAA